MLERRVLRLRFEVSWRVAPFGLLYVGPHFGTADVQMNVIEEIFLNFFKIFSWLEGRGISSRVS